MQVTKETLLARLASRTEHFMPPALLDSQLAALEEPDPIAEPCIIVEPADTAGKAVAAMSHSRREDGGRDCTQRMHVEAAPYPADTQEAIWYTPPCAPCPVGLSRYPGSHGRPRRLWGSQSTHQIFHS